MKKIIAVISAFSMLFVFASCGEKSSSEAPDEAASGDILQSQTEIAGGEEAESSSENSVEDSTAAVTDAKEETTAETTAVAQTEAKKEEKKNPSTNAEILAEYTRIMNQAKEDKPGFTFYEWQTLPDDPQSRVIAEGEAVIGTVLNIAGGFMKDEKKAKADAAVIGKDSDMYCFPIRDSDYGCLLTDADAIKSAKFEQLPNGNNKITIVLKSEVTPEPVTDKHSKTAPSNHGALFQPLPKKVIDDVLSNDFISAITDDVSFSYTYHDCEATVEYDPQNGHIVSVTQLSYVTITGSGKVTLIKLDITKQEFINEMHVVDIIY